MEALPTTDKPIVLRTDFSDDLAWETICGVISKPAAEMLSHVAFISDTRYQGAKVEQLISVSSSNRAFAFLFVVDTFSISHPEHPVLVLDLDSKRSFRVVPGQLSAVESNLSVANMDFEEFVANADEDGIFRGLDG